MRAEELGEPVSRWPQAPGAGGAGGLMRKERGDKTGDKGTYWRRKNLRKTGMQEGVFLLVGLVLGYYSFGKEGSSSLLPYNFKDYLGILAYLYWGCWAQIKVAPQMLRGSPCHAFARPPLFCPWHSALPRVSALYIFRDEQMNVLKYKFFFYS